MMDGSPIPVINGNIYNKTFQYTLLAHLANCTDLMKVAYDKLELSDFELGICQVVWEALQEYWAAYKALPTPELLQVVVAKVVNNADGRYKSYITPEETEALCSLMEFICGTTEFNPEFFKAELPKYLRWVRSSRTINQYKKSIEEGGDATHMISQLAKIEKETEGLMDQDDMHYVTDHPEVITDYMQERRVTTGSGKLDSVLDGGLRPGDIGCITACPGTGKTNVQLHFSVCAAHMDIESLVFSLELPGYKIKRRYLAMLAGIDAQITKKHIELWPEDAQMRLARVMDKSYRAANKTVILDRSKKRISVFEIEDTIGRWKEKIAKEKGSCEDCLLVCIDWLKYIILPNSRKKDEWEVLTEVCAELGMVARRQHVAIWTANQGKSEADGKILLRMKDTAFGYHINDALDVSIGLALSEESRVTEEDLVSDRAKSRKLMFNINKSRENMLKACELFQAPTLRFFDTEQQYAAYAKAIRSCSMSMHEASIPAHIRKLYAKGENPTYTTMAG